MQENPLTGGEIHIYKYTSNKYHVLVILNILYGEAQKICFWTAKQNYQLPSN
jgi:hypothetical protein